MPDTPAEKPPSPKPDRRKLEDIFGDALPDTTSDERDPGAPQGGGSDAWYHENRPPHHY